jgi:putative copper export protein
MAGSAPPTPTVVEVSTQVLYYFGLSTAFGIGMAVSALTIHQRNGGEVARRVRGFALPAVALVAITAVLHFAAASGGRGSTDTGRIALQVGGYALVLVSLIVLALRGTRTVGAVLAVSAAVTAAVPELPWSSVPTASRAASTALTLVHIFGALTWVGGLVVLAAAGLLDRRRRDARGGGRAEEWLHTWERFTVAALWAVGALIVSGSWLSWSHVGTVAQLFTTPYGRFLAVKLVLMGLLLVAGAYNVRVLIPRIQAARRRGDDRAALTIGVHHFPLVVLGECIVATAVLAIVAGHPAVGARRQSRGPMTPTPRLWERAVGHPKNSTGNRLSETNPAAAQASPPKILTSMSNWTSSGHLGGEMDIKLEKPQRTFVEMQRRFARHAALR